MSEIKEKVQQGLTLGRRWVMLRKKRKDLTYTRRTGIIFLKMILGFRDKEAEMIYNQQFSRKLPQSIQKIALRKLIMIDKAESLQDLRVPPANHLEMLGGNREGQYSIRINQQYRICFKVVPGGFTDVEIVDYH